MEESEKRRQRLMAMRTEAAQAGVYNGPENSGFPSGGLANPLIENEAISTIPLQYDAPRFDFYTDPMSAFSGNKRNNILPQVAQGHHNRPPRTPYQGMPPGPVHQNLGPRTFQTPVPHLNQGHPRSPLEPFSRPRGYPPCAWGPPPPNFCQGNNLIGPRFGHEDPGPPRAMEVASPFNTPQGNPPRPWGGSGDTFNYTTPPNSYGGNTFTGPGFGNQRRNQGYNNNSHYGSGRGKGRTSGSGPSGRKGGLGHGSTSSDLRPDKYYSKQMVEDPWEWMTPVIWEHGKVQDSEQSEHPNHISSNKEMVEERGGAREPEVSWSPKSISAKKTKYMSGSSNQPSLAEYLAASFNDPISDKEEQPGS